MPNSVTNIGDYAFKDCTSLTSITIPNSVKSMGSVVFAYCTGLTSINFEGTIAQWNIIRKFSNWDQDIGAYVVYCTDGNICKEHVEVVDAAVEPTCTETGLTEGKHCSVCGEVLVAQEVVEALGHSYESTVTPPTATADGSIEYTCPNCDDSYTEAIVPTEFTVTSENREMVGYTGATGEVLDIPAVFQNDGVWYRVTSIGDFAFTGCTDLILLTIPESVTSIGESAFEDCTGLTSIIIPGSVMSIGEGALWSCTSLSSITVDENNLVYHSINDCLIETATGTLIFGCQSSVIPDSVTSIGDSAFTLCSGLTSITIPNSVTNIGAFAFDCCTGLTSIIIPDSVTSIGEGAFAGSGLTNITIPDSIMSISDWAFYECKDLTSITIPDSVTSIGSRAFYGCTGLTSVTIPDSVTSIGSSAFYNCTGLTDVYYAGTEEEWAAIVIEDSNDCLTEATIHYGEVS